MVDPRGLSNSYEAFDLDALDRIVDAMLLGFGQHVG
jgi:hypothetical protein